LTVDDMSLTLTNPATNPLTIRRTAISN